MFESNAMEIGLACMCAVVCGTSFSLAGLDLRTKKKARDRLAETTFRTQVQEESSLCVVGIRRQVIVLLQTQSRAISLKSTRALRLVPLVKGGMNSFRTCIPKTGLASSITEQGYLHVRSLMCLVGLFGGLLVGALFSTECALLAGVGGAWLGWREPLSALKRQRDMRKGEMERHLSEMIEVLCLGLRSGLSFERSFELYHGFFQTTLARECSVTQRIWNTGLSTREEALRSLAASYDSQLFFRVIENIVRSLRFGSSLIDSLQASALEARATHKAQMQERVAKAPVKMMIPTAALILPAMLLLVLGPILLEMTQGF